jgi:hypothetical protein
MNIDHHTLHKKFIYKSINNEEMVNMVINWKICPFMKHYTAKRKICEEKNLSV